MSIGIPRTTPLLVQGVIETETGKDLSPFIQIANQITTDVCGASGYDDMGINSKMELIERWLSAHFYCIYDKQLASARAGSVGAGFQFKIGFGLKLTDYGQTAILLDTLGNLAKIDNSDQTKRKIKISGSWAGRRRLTSGDVNFGSLWSDITLVQ